MDTPNIDTFNVITSDGKQLGPFSHKGLSLQHSSGKIHDGDTVTGENLPEGMTVKDFLETHAENTSALPPNRKKASLPPVRKKPEPDTAGKKTVLPPKRTNIEKKTVAPDYYEPQPYTDIPLKEFAEKLPDSAFSKPVAFYSVCAIFVVVLIIYAGMSMSIGNSIVSDLEVTSKTTDYEMIWQVFGPFIGVLALAAIISFFLWIKHAASNARSQTLGHYNRYLPGIILSCLIPVYNIWGAYAQMTRLLNASLEPDGKSFLKFRLSVLLWVLCACLTTWLYINIDIETVQDMTTATGFFNSILYTTISLIVFILMTCALAFLINRSQEANNSIYSDNE